MALSIDQIKISKKILELEKEIKEIYYELEDIQYDYKQWENEEDRPRLLGYCEFLDSKAFSLRMDQDALKWQLNEQGINEETNPELFPQKKKVDNEGDSDLSDELPF